MRKLRTAPRISRHWKPGTFLEAGTRNGHRSELLEAQHLLRKGLRAEERAGVCPGRNVVLCLRRSCCKADRADQHRRFRLPRVEANSVSKRVGRTRTHRSMRKAGTAFIFPGCFSSKRRGVHIVLSKSFPPSDRSKSMNTQASSTVNYLTRYHHRDFFGISNIKETHLSPRGFRRMIPPRHPDRFESYPFCIGNFTGTHLMD